MQKTIAITYDTLGCIADKIKTHYVIGVLSILGICAVITATLVAWPALAYFASVLFV